MEAQSHVFCLNFFVHACVFRRKMCTCSADNITSQQQSLCLSREEAGRVCAVLKVLQLQLVDVYCRFKETGALRVIEEAPLTKFIVLSISTNELG